MSVAIFPFRQKIGGYPPSCDCGKTGRRPLNLDCAFKDKLGWSGQRHIRETFSVAAKINAQFTTAAHQNADRSADFFRGAKNKRARHNTSATSKRLIFDPALVGPNCDLLLAASF